MKFYRHCSEEKQNSCCLFSSSSCVQGMHGKRDEKTPKVLIATHKGLAYNY